MAALDLVDLVPTLKASLNAPGTEFFVAEDEDWVEALNAAFWWGRMRGYFTEYRGSLDRTQIVTVTPEGGPAMPLEVAQIVVAIAALNALEAKAFSLETKSVAKAGPVEVETQRSSTVIAALIKAKRAELDQIRGELLASQYAVYASVIDAVQAREGAFMRGEAAWVA